MSHINVTLRSSDGDTLEQAATHFEQAVLARTYYYIEEGSFDLTFNMIKTTLEQSVRTWIASAFVSGLIDEAAIITEGDPIDE